MKPSRRRIIWVGIAILVVVATLVAPPAIHRYKLSRSAEAFHAQVAELRATGEPVSAADLVPPPIADAENSAVDLMAAAVAAKVTAEEAAWGQLDHRG